MTTLVTPRVSRRTFVRHFVEMVLAMAVGMVVLDPLWPLPPAIAGRTDVSALVTATDMAIAMAVWMWHRGHGRAAVAEMTAAAYVPFLLLLVPWWAGLVTDGAVLLGGHLLMLPAMLLAMLRRAGEYGARRPGHVERHGLLARWPSVLALLATADNLLDPRPLPLAAMMILPLGYLAIGAARRTLRPRPVLLAQLGALAGYLVLLGAAAAAGARWGQILVGIGWILHAGWDAWHHRRDLVVPRPFAEWCAVVDLIIGVSVIAVAVSR
ncbi:hypothetical protein ACQP00_28880 [Dactylosporangium sp. CS-047395]|uniref:hypothetical protein n=1 Tax=Dactylosporangium sp. CS-047395 TaxID=3239936 RepID=UPI003D945C7D